MKYIILLALSTNAFASLNVESMLDEYATVYCENKKVKNCEVKHRICSREFLNDLRTISEEKAKENKNKCLKEYGI